MAADPIRAALKCVPMLPTEWQAACPACGNPFILHDGMIEETAAGTWLATDADRYPCCDSCGTQFEVAEMSTAAVEAAAREGE